jgi:hypothetical protein
MIWAKVSTIEEQARGNWCKASLNERLLKRRFSLGQLEERPNQSWIPGSGAS